jgi:hypothetical protein
VNKLFLFLILIFSVLSGSIFPMESFCCERDFEVAAQIKWVKEIAIQLLYEKAKGDDITVTLKALGQVRFVCRGDEVIVESDEGTIVRYMMVRIPPPGEEACSSDEED